MADCARHHEAMWSCERGADFEPEVQAHLMTCRDCARVAEDLRVLDKALQTVASETMVPPPFERIAGRARSAARGRRQLRVARRFLPMTLVFASAVAITVGVTRFARRPDTRLTAVSGEVLDAPHGMTQTVLLDGSHMTLTSGRAVIEVSERRRSVVRIDAGTAYLSVPHRAEGSTFILTTGEAEMRVWGTRFAVERSRGNTSVSVSEGTVEVRPRASGSKPFLLTKGQSRSVSTEPPASEVAREQARSAWRLSREGDRAGALAAYRRALSMLPAEARPLWADNASAQLALLAEREDAAAGAAAWQAYLERFPAGIHASMARDRLTRFRTGPGR